MYFCFLRKFVYNNKSYIIYQNELKLSIEEQKHLILESKISEKEKHLNENAKTLGNFQKEVNN